VTITVFLVHKLIIENLSETVKNSLLSLNSEYSVASKMVYVPPIPVELHLDSSKTSMSPS